MHRRFNLTVIFSTVFITASLFASDDDGSVRKTERTVYSQPEQLVQALCETLKQGDLSGALALFGYERLLNTSLAVDTVPATAKLDNILFLVGEESYADLRLVELRNNAVVQLRYFLSALLLADEFPTMLELRPFLIPRDDGAAEHVVDKLSAALDPRHLATLRMVRLDRLPDDGPEYSAYIENMKAGLAVEDFAECAVLYELSGKTYASMLTLFRDEDDGWAIVSLLGLFSMQRFKQFNNPFPQISEQEYLGLIW